jgi:hypothetical protein
MTAYNTTFGIKGCLDFVHGPQNIKIIMFLGSKVRLVRRADNLTAVSEPIV